MSRIPLPEGGPDDLEFVRLASMQPDMGNAMIGLASAIYDKCSLPITVREAVRMRIAQINACLVCQNTRFKSAEADGVDENFYAEVENWQGSSRFSAAESIAIEYAELLAEDHLSIDENFFVRLGEHYSPVEIYELTVVTVGLLANGRVMQVLQIDQSCTLELP